MQIVWPSGRRPNTPLSREGHATPGSAPALSPASPDDMTARRRLHGGNRQLKISDEADARGLELGKKEGEAFGRILKHMLEDIADGGEEIAHGDYQDRLRLKRPRACMCRVTASSNGWRPSKRTFTSRFWSDKADGRLLPGLDIDVTLTDDKGKEIGTHRQQLLWHPYSIITAATGPSRAMASSRSACALRRPTSIATTRSTASACRRRRRHVQERQIENRPRIEPCGQTHTGRPAGGRPVMDRSVTWGSVTVIGRRARTPAARGASAVLDDAGAVPAPVLDDAGAVPAPAAQRLCNRANSPLYAA